VLQAIDEVLRPLRAMELIGDDRRRERGNGYISIDGGLDRHSVAAAASPPDTRRLRVWRPTCGRRCLAPIGRHGATSTSTNAGSPNSRRSSGDIDYGPKDMSRLIRSRRYPNSRRGIGRVDRGARR